MADIKKYGADESRSSLKLADAEKSGSTAKSPERVQEFIGEKMIGDIESGKGLRAKRKKRVSVILDIIVAIILLSLVAGAVAGAYYLFKYYSDDYDSVNVKYTFAFAYTGDSDPMNMQGQEIYYTNGGNSYYFGKIISAKRINLDGSGENAYAITVSVNAKYRDDSGYSLDGYKLAVGSEYTLRSNTTQFKGVVVDLVRSN